MVGHGRDGKVCERLGMGMFYLILDYCVCLSGGCTDVGITCQLCGACNHTNFVELLGKRILEVFPSFSMAGLQRQSLAPS